MARGKTLKYRSLRLRCTALQARTFAAAYVTGGQSVADGAAAVGKSPTECRDWTGLPIVARAIAAIQGLPCDTPSFGLTDALTRAEDAYELARRQGDPSAMLKAVDIMAKLGKLYKDDEKRRPSIDTLSLFLAEIAGRQEMPGKVINAQFEPKGAPLLPDPTLPPTEVGIESHQIPPFGSPPSAELPHVFRAENFPPGNATELHDILAFADSIDPQESTIDRPGVLNGNLSIDAAGDYEFDAPVLDECTGS